MVGVTIKVIFLIRKIVFIYYSRFFSGKFKRYFPTESFRKILSITKKQNNQKENNNQQSLGR